MTRIDSVSQTAALHSQARTGRRTDRRQPRCRPTLETLESRVVPATDAVLDWNAVLLQTNADDHALAQPDQPGPTRTARAFAIVHAAIYDAANGVQRQYEPYLVKTRAPRGADIRAAIAGAAYTTLVGLFPQQRRDFTRALSDALRAIPNGFGEVSGLAYGVFVGARHLLDRVGDGANAPMSYTPTGAPGNHDVDPLHPGQGFLDPQWGNVRPFTLDSGSQFRAPPPPDLTSPEYTAAFQQVYLVGSVDAETSDRDSDGAFDRTPEQTEIGIYWGYDGSPGLGTPPRLYNQMTRAIAGQAHNSLLENARLFALLNLAQADAGITSWETKYEYDFWRPILAIREGDSDGNPDTVGDEAWSPLGAPRSNDPGPNKNFTPPFPAYTSGHATFGSAAFQVLTNFYGGDSIPGGSLTFVSDEFNGQTIDQNGLPRPLRPRTFTTFDQMTQENAISRIYLGIHWSFDASEGINHGRSVGDWVVENYLRPLSLSSATSASASAGGSALTALPTFASATPPTFVVGDPVVSAPVVSSNDPQGTPTASPGSHDSAPSSALTDDSAVSPEEPGIGSDAAPRPIGRTLPKGVGSRG